MKKPVFYFLFIFPLFLAAQNSEEVYEIKYQQTANGEKTGDGFSILYMDSIVFLSRKEDKIQTYTDFKNQQNISIIEADGQVYQLSTPFDKLPQPELGDQTKEMAGFQCKYASWSYFSNKIEMWYTEESTAKGSPYQRFLCNENALAVQIIINGNRTITLDTIIKTSDKTPLKAIDKQAIQVNDAEFEELKINSRFIKFSVFNDEQINFDTNLEVDKGELAFDSTYHFSNGGIILKRIRLTDELRKSGSIYARLTCKSNGDAYDRTGSVFVLPPTKEDQISMLNAFQNGLELLPVFTDNNGQNYQGIIQQGNYQPPIEIMRFFTSFGVDYFNELRAINNYPWANEAVYKQDVSAFIPNDQEEIYVGVFIGNYDSGGHIVSLEFDFHPAFDEETQMVKYINPLFSTVNIMEMQGQNYGKLFNNDTLRLEFKLPENIKDLNLLFTSTGHGGWGGGDEFNPKLNQIWIDGEEVFNIVPWRTDCATYRFLNPASGNFGNGLSSSDLSRSNWCPATLTPPYLIPLNDLKPGFHKLEVVIDQGEDEGGSTSHWSVTGVLTGKINE